MEFGELPGWQYIHTRKVSHCNSMEIETPMLKTLLDLTLYNSSSDYSSVSCITLKKSVDIKEYFSGFCEPR